MNNHIPFGSLAVLDLAEASQRFQSRSPRGQHEHNNGTGATVGLGEALSSLRMWYTTHVHRKIYIVGVGCISFDELDPRARDVYRSIGVAAC